MKISLRAKISLSFGLALLLLGLLGLASYRSASRMVESSLWIAHTNKVLSSIGKLRASLDDAEKAAREYEGDRQEPYRQQYAAATQEIRKADNELRNLTVGDAEQERSLALLDKLLAQWIAMQAHPFAETKKAGATAEERGQTLDLLEQVNGVLKSMQDHEQRILVARSGKALVGVRRTRFLGEMVTVLALFLVAGSFVLIRRDIAERERAEQEVRRQKEFSDALIGSSMDGILAYDRELRYTVWNPAMERLTGAPKQEVLGKSARDTFPFVTETDVQRHMVEALEGRNAAAVDQPFTIPNTGRGGYFEGSYAPLRDGNGEIIGGLGVIRDISERKQAEETLRRLSGQLMRAQESERRRIARELHDSTGQRLAALAMNLSWLESSGNCGAPRANEVLSESRSLIEQSVKEIRTLSYLLHPPLLEELGLASTVSWYVQGFVDRSGIQVDLDIEAELGRMGREAELALFRVVQEGLTNVQRHSGSSKARVRIAREDSNAVVEVSDEGCGMPAGFSAVIPPVSRIGVGIAGMQERLRELGGELEIRSSETGTTVKASIPSRERT
ncbi:MAG: PAS domain-containing protein [Acidobacteriota bacterium]|nr:PAS domain-containing protein [Acidobacteriota bacterium]